MQNSLVHYTSSATKFLKLVVPLIIANSLVAAHADDSLRVIVQSGRIALIEVRDGATISYSECLRSRSPQKEYKPPYQWCRLLGAPIPNTPEVVGRVAEVVRENLEAQASEMTRSPGPLYIHAISLAGGALTGGGMLAALRVAKAGAPESAILAFMVAGLTYVGTRTLANLGGAVRREHAQVIRKMDEDHPLLGPSLQPGIDPGPGSASDFPIFGWMIEPIIRAEIGYRRYVDALRDALVNQNREGSSANQFPKPTELSSLRN